MGFTGFLKASHRIGAGKKKRVVGLGKLVEGVSIFVAGQGVRHALKLPFMNSWKS